MASCGLPIVSVFFIFYLFHSVLLWYMLKLKALFHRVPILIYIYLFAFTSQPMPQSSGKYFKLIILLYSNAPLEWDFVY